MRDFHTENFRVSWQGTIFSVFVAGACAILGYLLFNGHQAYAEFVSGHIAFEAESKNQDYACLLGGFLGMVLSYSTLAYLEPFLFKRLGEHPVRAATTWALLPAAIFSGQLLLYKAQTGMLGLAIALPCAVLAAAAVAAFRKMDVASGELGGTVSAILLAAFSGLGLSLTANRLLLPVSRNLDVLRALIAAAIITVSLGVVSLWLLVPKDGIRRGLAWLVTASQLALPLLYLVVLPEPMLEGDRLRQPYRIAPALGLALILVAFSYFDLWRRRRNFTNLMARISPFCLAAILIFLKCDPVPSPFIDPDDYHMSEYLLPWWLTRSFGFIPFWDYEPARGLYNYVPGFLADLFFGGAAPAYYAVRPLEWAFFLLPGYWLISRFTGALIAFIVLLSFPGLNGLSEIDLWVTGILLMLVAWLQTAAPARWLVSWVAAGTLLILFAPGQGALLLVATLPLALVAAFRALRLQQARLFQYVGIALAILLVLGLVTPLGKMLVGAVRYGLEQSSVNSTAHGLPISDGLEIHKPINPLLWETFRASFILVAAWSALVALRAFLSKPGNREDGEPFVDRTGVLSLAVPITLLLLLFVVRAAGRVDAGVFATRMGNATCWAVGLLFPLLLIAWYGTRNRAVILLATTFAASIVNVYFVNFDFGRIAGETWAVSYPSGKILSGASLGMPNLGEAAFTDPAQLPRLLQLQKVLTTILKPGETYLDFTNRSADYFYLGLPEPIESGPYNLPSEAGQLRSIHHLENARTPVALVGSSNIAWDAGSPSLRAHLIYRYLVQHYLPVKIGPSIWMVLPERLKAARQMASTDEPQDALQQLDDAFLPGDLKQLPASWGKSARILDHKAIRTLDLPDAQSNANGEVDYSMSPVNGRDAGLLQFDFHCQFPAAKPGISVTWGIAGQAAGPLNRAHFQASEGTQIVPLDAFPRWLTATGIVQLEILMTEPAGCPAFSVSHVTLLERKAAVTLK